MTEHEERDPLQELLREIAGHAHEAQRSLFAFEKWLWDTRRVKWAEATVSPDGPLVTDVLSNVREELRMVSAMSTIRWTARDFARLMQPQG